MMSQTRISSRYGMHSSSGLWFFCQAWKSCIGSSLPRLALGRGGVVWLHCSCGLSAEQVELGHCLVGARLICGLVSASLFLSRLGVGWSIGEAVAGMVGQAGTPVDTEHTVVWDYGFPVWLENTAMALICSIWLGGVMGAGDCTAHVAGLLLCWAACQVVFCGGCKILW